MSDHYPQFPSSMEGVETTQQQEPQQQYQRQLQQQQQQQQYQLQLQQQQQQQYIALHQSLQQQQAHFPHPYDGLPLLPLSLQQPLQQYPQQPLQQPLQQPIQQPTQQQQQPPQPQPQFGQFQTFRYFPGYAEPVLFSVPQNQRARRKSSAASGSDNVKKHRRTRSGCFTCRLRRVKCDEARPICDRCKKGNRDCSYPEPPATRQSASSSREPSTVGQYASPNSSDDDDDDDYGGDSPDGLPQIQSYQLHTIPDDQAAAAVEKAFTSASSATSSSNRLVQRPRRRPSSTSLLGSTRTSGDRGGPAGKRTRQPSEETGMGSSPATPSGTATTPSHGSFPVATVMGGGYHYPFPTFASPPPSLFSSPLARLLPTSPPPVDSSHLSPELQFLLGFFCEHITHLHYGLATDADNFVRGILPTLAAHGVPDEVGEPGEPGEPCEPLLSALAAFAAYHCVLRNPDGHLQPFLQHYNQSVRLLLGVLQRREPHRLGTLLTVLQLATIEEHLGDWVSLMGHQRAAREMLTSLFAPETVMQTPVGRMALHWYARFDVFVGLMGGFQTALTGAWFDAAIAHYEDRATQDPGDLRMRVEVCSARLRRISMEMSLLFGRPHDAGTEAAAASTPPISGGPPPMDAYFVREHARLLAALHAWKAGLDAVVAVEEEESDEDAHVDEKVHIKKEDDNDADARAQQPRRGYPRTHPLLVTDFGHMPPLSADDIVNPYEPGTLYYEPLFGVTILTCEWQSIVAMHELQAAQLARHGRGLSEGSSPTASSASPGGGATFSSPASPVRHPPAASNASTVSAASATSATPAIEPAVAATLTQRAYAICQIIDALERWPASPPGCLIMTQAMLTIAALFLPRDARHHMWMRRKFAVVESMGHIFPLTMRTRMAELFNDSSCVRWWLPSDDGFTPILRRIRAFADERNVTAVSEQTQNLREIRHVFAKMQLGGGR